MTDTTEPSTDVVDVASEPSEPIEPWTPGRVRKGPALLVLGLVAIVSIGGFLLAGLGSGSHPATGNATKTNNAAGIRAFRAAPALKRIAAGGNPPSDIVAALVLPDGAQVTGSLNSDKGIGLYDRSLLLTVPLSMGQIVSFYKDELKANGWKIAGIDASADGKGKVIYATHPSEDGYYWEVGAVVEPASPSISPALAGAASADTASLKLRLFEVDDAN